MNQNQNPMPNEEMQRYFNSLPPFVQESIMQSGAMPASLDELRSCGENILQRGQE